MSVVSSVAPGTTVNTRFDGSEAGTENNKKPRSRFKRFRDNEPHTPLKNENLYQDIYQGMYDNIDSKTDDDHDLMRESIHAQNQVQQINQIYEKRTSPEIQGQPRVENENKKAKKSITRTQEDNPGGTLVECVQTPS